MSRKEEAVEILSKKASPAIGIPALGIATFDIDRVIADYTAFYHNPLPDGPFGDTRYLESHALHGYILWQIHQDFVGDDKFESFLSSIYPRLVAHQKHIYDHHCPLDNGLVIIDYIIDPLVNSLFACSNDYLLELGYALGLSSEDLFDQNELTLHSMNELLWHKGAGLYHKYDVNSNVTVENQQSSGFLPVIGGVPDINQVLVMVQRAFGDDFRQEGFYSFPSYNLNLHDTEYTDLDRGGISCTTNWLLIEGLSRYDMDDLADVILEDTLVLLERDGFYSHFDPRKSIDTNGIGHDRSATSAAIYLHLTK